MGFFSHKLDSNFYLVDLFPIVAQIAVVRPEYLLFENFDVNVKLSGSASFLTFGTKNTFNAKMPSGSVVSAAEDLINSDLTGAIASVVPIDFSMFGFNDSPNSYSDPSYLFNFDVNTLLPLVGLSGPLGGSATYFEMWLLGARPLI
jgi:hypothetical protein